MISNATISMLCLQWMFLPILLHVIQYIFSFRLFAMEHFIILCLWFPLHILLSPICSGDFFFQFHCIHNILNYAVEIIFCLAKIPPLKTLISHVCVGAKIHLRVNIPYISTQMQTGIFAVCEGINLLILRDSRYARA